MPAKDQEREAFHTFFGYVFRDCSDTMVQKCWIQFKSLQPHERERLLNALKFAAIGVGKRNQSANESEAA